MKRKRYFVGMQVVLCFFCVGAHTQVLELPLTYERYPDAEEEYQFRPFGSAFLVPLSAPPEGEWKLPKLVSEHPLYAWVRIGEQERLLVLDQSDRNAAFYDRLYFDANANRDLTAGQVIDARGVEADDGQYFSAFFRGIDTETLVDGISLPYSFSIYVRYYSPERPSWGARLRSFLTRSAGPKQPISMDRLNIYLSPHCMYTATLTLDDAVYQLYLGDSNANGRFDDWGTIIERDEDSDHWMQTHGDTFYLTSEDAELGFYDGHLLGKYLNLKDSLYALDISQTEERLTLTPVMDNAVEVALPTSVHRITLISDDGGVMSCMAGDVILAPPGTYRLRNYVLYHDEPNGARWRAIASGTWDSPETAITTGADATLAIGEPFRPIVSVPTWSRYNLEHHNDSVRLDLRVLGAGAEVISDLRCIDNVEESAIAMSEYGRPKEATYRILMPDGEVVVQGKFEYG